MESERVRSAKEGVTRGPSPSTIAWKASASSSSPGRKRRFGVTAALRLVDGLVDDAAILQEAAHGRRFVLVHERGHVAALADGHEARIGAHVDHRLGHV